MERRETYCWTLLAGLHLCGGLVAGCASDRADDAEPSAGSAGTSAGMSAAAGNGAIAGEAGTSGASGTTGTAGTGGAVGAGTAGGGGTRAAAAGASGSGTAGTGGAAGTGNAGAGGDSGGTGGASGSAGMAGSSGDDAACDMAFIEAGKCDPEIEFQNDEADGDGAMFDEVIPDAVATMKEVACRVCTILYRDPDEVTRNPPTIRLRIYDFDGVANAGGGNINFSTRHIANYDEPEDARFEFVGVLIHEVTHLYQWNDGGGGLVEGMADFVRIRAGHHRMSRRSPGGAWTDAYTTSGFFFSWLAGPGGLQEDGREPPDPDIGWAINQQMNGSWSEQVFEERLGETVDALWDEYQQAIDP
jgi:hypothetical protein